MKVTTLKSERQVDKKNDVGKGIIAWGKNNDFVEKVIEIVASSATGSSCVDTYAKFIGGGGFADSFYDVVLNIKGQTADDLLDLIKKDLAKFGGIALHVNYNLNGKISQIQHIPFEWVRLGNYEDNHFTNKVAVHDDWCRKNTQVKQWRQEDIRYYNLFNPTTALKEAAEVGGLHNYKGQVLYYSNEGVNVYPTPIYLAVMTDMSTEEGLSNISYRNVRYNFLPSGAIIDKRSKDIEYADDDANENALLAFQGDNNACKIMYMQVDSDDEKPEFLSFGTQNYDKEFAVTTETIKKRIGEAFRQPPILRCEDVGSNFGADAIGNAYKYYNAITATERLTIERIFAKLMENWKEEGEYDTQIKALTYNVGASLAEKLGDKLTSFMEVFNSEIANKRNIIATLFGLDEGTLNNLNL